MCITKNHATSSSARTFPAQVVSPRFPPMWPRCATAVEFTLGIDAIKKEDLTVSIGFNGAFNKNKSTRPGWAPGDPPGYRHHTRWPAIGHALCSELAGRGSAIGQPVYEDINGNRPTYFPQPITAPFTEPSFQISPAAPHWISAGKI